MRAILKTGSKILKSGNKIFTVGDIRPPVLDLNASIINQADQTKVAVWHDSSDNRAHSIQGDVAFQPVLKIDDNGVKEVVFTGTEFLNLIKGITARTVMIVTKSPITASNHNYQTLLNAVGDPSYFGGGGPGITGNVYFGANPDFGYGGSFPANKLYVNGVLTQFAHAFRNNFFQLLTFDSGHSTPIVDIIGKRADGYPYLGSIRRVITYDYRLPSTDRKQKELQVISEHGL